VLAVLDFLDKLLRLSCTFSLVGELYRQLLDKGEGAVRGLKVTPGPLRVHAGHDVLDDAVFSPRHPSTER
jgi:hypothetical protein